LDIEIFAPVLGTDNSGSRDTFTLSLKDRGYVAQKSAKNNICEGSTNLRHIIANATYDLKIGKLTHQDLGQMQMYVNYFDRYVKTKEESSTIGIILCRKSREALVKITLPKDANIHAKEYRLYLPTKEELKNKLLDWIKDE